RSASLSSASGEGRFSLIASRSVTGGGYHRRSPPQRAPPHSSCAKALQCQRIGVLYGIAAVVHLSFCKVHSNHSNDKSILQSAARNERTPIERGQFAEARRSA